MGQAYSDINRNSNLGKGANLRRRGLFILEQKTQQDIQVEVSNRQLKICLSLRREYSC